MTTHFCSCSPIFLKRAGGEPGPSEEKGEVLGRNEWRREVSGERIRANRTGDVDIRTERKRIRRDGGQWGGGGREGGVIAVRAGTLRPRKRPPSAPREVANDGRHRQNKG